VLNFPSRLRRQNVTVVVTVTHVMATMVNVEGSQEATAGRMRTVRILSRKKRLDTGLFLCYTLT
jgi:hypothetical protein